jgi:hypothetical protein
VQPRPDHQGKSSLQLVGDPPDALARLVSAGDPGLVVSLRPGTRAADLAPGLYRLELSADGFEPVTDELRLHAGTAVRYRYLLEPADPPRSLLAVLTDPQNTTIRCLECPTAAAREWSITSGKGDLELPPGSYWLRFSAPGRRAHDERFELAPAVQRQLRVSLPPVPAARRSPAAGRPAPPPSSAPRPVPAGMGRVDVATDPPGTAVKLGSRELGRTPCTLELPPGRHRILLSAVGFEEVITDLQVEEGKATRLEWALARLSGTLDVKSFPPGAEVWLDGVRAGTTPRLGIRHPFGAVRVQIRHAAHPPWTRILLVKPGEHQVVDAVLGR